MAATSKTRLMGDVPDAFMGLLRAQMRLGEQVFEDLTGMKAPDMAQSWNDWQRAMQTPPSASGACTVPPPCWMPKQLGDVTSYACGCNTVRVRIEVTNCDRVPRLVSVRTDGVQGVQLSPASATINPMRRTMFEAAFKVPDDVKEGTEFETLIWVEGCHQHVLRWKIVAGKTGLDTTYEVKVQDCPDYRHHWYDHFYCARHCSHTRSPNNG
jgi:hypothetical protein